MEKRNEVRKESGKTGEKGGLIGGKGRKSERRGCRARNSLWSKSKIHCPTSEAVSEVRERANE